MCTYRTSCAFSALKPQQPKSVVEHRCGNHHPIPWITHAHPIKRMHRLLDLITEQGSSGLGSCFTLILSVFVYS